LNNDETQLVNGKYGQVVSTPYKDWKTRINSGRKNGGRDEW
jgi:hypothetical protein